MADWDQFSGIYDEIFLESPQYVDTVERMVANIEHGDVKSILDLGCGTGNIINAVLKRFPEASVTGIDPSEGMRETTAVRFADNPRVRVSDGNALSIPLGSGEFDYVLSNLVLHHLLPEERGACAGEIARVLKPGGRLVYADMFSGVDGPPDDPERCRDIIEKFTGAALYCLDHGAYEMMMIILQTLPADLKNDGEYLTTTGVWGDVLCAAGFEDISVGEVPPKGLGIHIIRATLSP
ncbi:MAG: class I SAM-dependent methyltransferase [Actinobacteria bacterium]|nr:class I SAM-dependent methyltransferase [Actinomycetota bacterium]MCG2817397.1 class I SAM-dependent methyltransferase [Actinomycetes bacterium]MBU4179760.1 class I SAM-dependent methyltransferase [Actinomycetota bacterium]MBU4217808.1 class I SAM-dependent methyltransferase [Actinomycetota bacterium]MBU4359514.1 class I SAM-dependent methyltransferase [Actinomycetota bacterium]